MLKLYIDKCSCDKIKYDFKVLIWDIFKLGLIFRDLFDHMLYIFEIDLIFLEGSLLYHLTFIKSSIWVREQEILNAIPFFKLFLNQIVSIIITKGWRSKGTHKNTK